MHRFLTTTALALAGFTASTAVADTIDVCAGCDYTSIQAAIDNAADGDEILVAPGVYTSDHPAHVVDMLGKAITLRSSGGPDVTFIDGEGVRRGIVCFNGETADTIIEGFTIQNGFGAEYDYDGDGESSSETTGGGALNLFSSPTVTNCTFTNNAADDGGGMHNWDSSPTLTNCTFTNNSAATTNWSRGGGMYNRSSSPTLTDCTFTNNSATRSGGGMFNQFSDSTLTGCTFTNNSTTAHYSNGGGIANVHGSLTLIECTFTGNSAAFPNDESSHWDSRGGGFYAAYCDPILTNCTFTDNSAVWGGGMLVEGFCHPTLTDCTFTDNSAHQGGGFWSGYGKAVNDGTTMTNCTFTNNSAIDGHDLDGTLVPGRGGGMYFWAIGDVAITNCRFTGNSASGVGGGIWGTAFQPKSLIDCTVCENTVDNVATDDNQIEGHSVENISSGNCIAADCTDCDDTCIGDLNDDGVVDAADIGLLFAVWGSDDPEADFDGDGTVGALDLGYVLGYWGPCP